MLFHCLLAFTVVDEKFISLIFVSFVSNNKSNFFSLSLESCKICLSIKLKNFSRMCLEVGKNFTWNFVFPFELFLLLGL